MPNSQSSAEKKMEGKKRGWRKAFLFILMLWAGSTILLSTTWFRAWVSYPLHVSNMQSNADIAYVMSDGHAYWNRLCAASDLYHTGKIKNIAIQENPTSSRYDFVLRRSQTVSQRSIRYLESLGVPQDRIVTVPTTKASPLVLGAKLKLLQRHFPRPQTWSS